MIPRFPSKKRAKEKRPLKGEDEKAILRKIIKKPGKERRKFHRFLKQTGDDFIKKIELFDSFYNLEKYEKTWEFDGDYLPRPILK